VAPMNAMGSMCPDCGAEVVPGARFCPRCGSFAVATMPAPVPGGQPQWPGPGPGGTVTVAQAPRAAGRVPRAALPAAPPRAEPPADATRADWFDLGVPTVTRQPAYLPPPDQPFEQQPPQSFQPQPQPVQQPPPQPFQPPPQSFQQPPPQPFQPPPPQPFQEPGPPTRAEPARYQAPLPQDGPPGFLPDGYLPGGHPPDGYAPTEFAPGGYRRDDYPPTEFTPGGYPQDSGYPPRPGGGARRFESSPSYPGLPPDELAPGQPPKAPRQPPRRHDRGRRGVPLAVWVVLLVLLVGGAGAALKFGHPFSHAAASGKVTASAPAGGSASGRPAASHRASASPGASSGTAAASTERQAAVGVAALLSQSAADRTATNAAASDVDSCGPKLQSDPAAFASAVTSRKALLSKLAALPGRAALPPALLTDLTNAWQASVTADQAYTKWANDELAKKCVPHDTADPGYQATVAPNQQATTGKSQFAAAWNPLAAKYGLSKYQPGQL
jgi:zinc-ribbon domain